MSEEQSPAGEVPGAATPGAERVEAAPGPERVASGARVNRVARGARISGDAELLTNIVYPDGSEVAFVRIGSGFLISELTAANTSSRTTNVDKKLSPVEQFRALAPELPVPAELVEAEEQLGWSLPLYGVDAESVVSGSESVVNEAESWEELDPGQGSEDVSAADGLQAYSGCSASVFRSEVCDKLGTGHGYSWKKFDHSDSVSLSKKNVWKAESNICVKQGFVTLRLIVGGTDIDFVRDITTGEADHRHWQTRTCPKPSPWCIPGLSCFPQYCFPDGRTVTNEVHIFSFDDAHLCGYYEYEN